MASCNHPPLIPKPEDGVSRCSRELCPAFPFSIVVPREFRARFLPCLPYGTGDGPGRVWSKLLGPSSKFEEQAKPVPRGRLVKGSHLASEAEHLLGMTFKALVKGRCNWDSRTHTQLAGKAKCRSMKLAHC